jgi:AbrB family looped-hinge helix DNA binding protein
MPQIKLGRQGRIVIPADIREELGLEEGTRLIPRVDAQRLVLETPETALARIRREFREGVGDRDLVAELIAERREEARREEEDLEAFKRRL